MVPEVGHSSISQSIEFNRDTNSRSSFKVIRQEFDRDQMSNEDRETANFETK